MSPVENFISPDAEVSGSAWVYGRAEVYDSAWVSSGSSLGRRSGGGS